MQTRSGCVAVTLACAVIALLFSGCGQGGRWTAFRGSAGDGRSASHIDAPIGLRWKIPLGKHEAERRFFNQPLVADNTIYFGSSDGNFYAMDIRTGLMNWTVRTGGPVNSCAHVDDKRVYFGSNDGKIYGVDRKTGEVAWTYQTKSGVNSTIVPYKNLVVAASDYDSVYFLTTDGELELQLPNQSWSMNSFCIHDGTLVFAPGTPESPSDLAVYDIDDRSYRWSIYNGSGGYPWFSFPAVRGNSLFYSAVGFGEDGGLVAKFTCLDFGTGETRWEVAESAEFPPTSPLSQRDLFFENTRLLDYSAPLLWRDSVIYAAGDHALRCYDAASGSEKWKTSYPDPIATAVTLAGDRLYFGLRATGSEGYLVCASPTTGSPIWKIPVEGTILNSPVVAGRWIMFGTDAGFFYVYESVY
jgi:outer membrane protein assembly factor BamB